jgi:plasmid stabilization system protein ParE
MKLPLHVGAQQDYREAIRHYERCEAGLGLEFEAAVEAHLEQIAENPRQGPPVPDVDHCRRFRIQRFPYAIIYHLRGRRWTVLAIAHTSREPGFWKDRLATPLD